MRVLGRPGGGSLGVAFFFVLSGFSLTLGYGEKIISEDFSYKSYITKRLIKFYPIHWLCLIAAIPCVLIEGKWLTSAFCLNVALLQTWIPFTEYYFSFNSVSWYLANTVFLALIFPILCRFIEKLNKKGMWLLIIFLCIAYTGIQIVLYPHDSYAFVYINPIARTPDFIIGILLALYYKRIKENGSQKLQRFVDKNNSLLFIVCLIAFFFMIYVSTLLTNHQTFMAFYYWPFIIIIIGSAGLLGVSSKNNLLRNTVLVRLGSISFEFYMIHQLVIRYYNYLQESIDLSDGFLQKIIITFTLSVILSYLISRLYEKPITKWLSIKHIK